MSNRSKEKTHEYNQRNYYKHREKRLAEKKEYALRNKDKIQLKDM
jgi:hypothetical protein